MPDGTLVPSISPGMPGVSKNWEDQTEDPFGELECSDLAQIE